MVNIISTLKIILYSLPMTMWKRWYLWIQQILFFILPSRPMKTIFLSPLLRLDEAMEPVLAINVSGSEACCFWIWGKSIFGIFLSVCAAVEIGEALLWDGKVTTWASLTTEARHGAHVSGEKTGLRLTLEEWEINSQGLTLAILSGVFLSRKLAHPDC